MCKLEPDFVILIYTLSGKTMTANAVANYLKKKILLVTVSVMMERDLTKVQLVCPRAAE